MPLLRLLINDMTLVFEKKKTYRLQLAARKVYSQLLCPTCWDSAYRSRRYPSGGGPSSSGDDGCATGYREQHGSNSSRSQSVVTLPFCLNDLQHDVVVSLGVILLEFLHCFCLASPNLYSPATFATLFVTLEVPEPMFFLLGEASRRYCTPPLLRWTHFSYEPCTF